MDKKKTGKRFGSFEEAIDMPSGDKYLIVEGDTFLRYNEATRKHELVRLEHIIKYDNTGEHLKQAYTNEVVVDYDASDKLIFEYKLKGRTDPDDPLNQ